jgi:hypothetical protein
MAIHTNSDDLTLASTLSQLSADDFDEQAAQLRSRGSASVDRVPRPTTPSSDEKDDLALALSLSQLSSDKPVIQLDPRASTGASDEARSCTPSNENNDDDPEPALNLSQLSTEIFEQQARELNREREPRDAAEGALTSSRSATPPSEVRARHHPYDSVGHCTLR